jgi:hypothetical protein
MEPPALENLRILSETAAHLRAAPSSRWAKRRRDEAVRWAAKSHSTQSIAEAAEISIEEVNVILVETGGATPSPAPSGDDRSEARPHLRARFRTVR